MRVHRVLLLAYLVALVAYAAAQGSDNGGNSGNANLGMLPLATLHRLLCGLQRPMGDAAQVSCKHWGTALLFRLCC